ncbi:MAG: bifunctional riboflavin kinase/FAD synthetase [Chloroflexota bacterium]|nr:MAG: bifunctional riboflavin kinase/FMN adenylyltransferase [Chloroflexota bacterium]
MNIVHGLPRPINEQPTVMTIGAFDGLHRGHQHLIGTVVERARALGCQSAVLTFDPHPDAIIRPERAQPVLTTVEERAEVLAELGVDLLIVVPFTRQLMSLGAREFMGEVCDAVALRELWIGWDFALGRKREGDARRLGEIGQELGYSVHTVERVTLGGETVSSSSIRAALEAGDVAKAASMLGRPFSVRGEVVAGDRRGRTIGFPTANIAVEPGHATPSNGVYVCYATVGGARYGAVTNIGVRPTFDGTKRTVEAYLLDFTDEIYGEVLKLEFLQRLRGEQKFDGISALVAQITRDVAEARTLLTQRDDT